MAYRCAALLMGAGMLVGGVVFPAQAAVSPSTLPFVLRNAVADTVAPVAARADWQIEDLAKCRSLVVDEISSKAYRVGLGDVRRLVDELASGTLRLPVFDTQILNAANDLIGYLERNTFTMSCINAVASGGSMTAGCFDSIADFREFSSAVLLKMTSVSTAVSEAIRAKCDIHTKPH